MYITQLANIVLFFANAGLLVWDLSTGSYYFAAMNGCCAIWFLVAYAAAEFNNYE